MQRYNLNIVQIEETSKSGYFRLVYLFIYLFPSLDTAHPLLIVSIAKNQNISSSGQ